MIVIGADTHKRSHTVAAIETATGGVLGERTVSARQRSFDALLAWARAVSSKRTWAIEDCRHVSGALERFLLSRGEAVVRIAPKLTVRERKTVRASGKSDAIDAVAIARAALREGRCFAARVQPLLHPWRLPVVPRFTRLLLGERPTADMDV